MLATISLVALQSAYLEDEIKHNNRPITVSRSLMVMQLFQPLDLRRS